MGPDLNFLKSRQVALLALGLIPGILAATKIFSAGQAAMSLMILFVISRKFANARQKQFEFEEAERVEEEKRVAKLTKRRSKGKSKNN